MTRNQAIQRLTARYNEQAEHFPTMLQDIPVDLYISRNIGAVMGGDMLASYDEDARAARHAAVIRSVLA